MYVLTLLRKILDVHHLPRKIQDPARIRTRTFVSWFHKRKVSEKEFSCHGIFVWSVLLFKGDLVLELVTSNQSFFFFRKDHFYEARPLGQGGMQTNLLYSWGRWTKDSVKMYTFRLLVITSFFSKFLLATYLWRYHPAQVYAWGWHCKASVLVLLMPVPSSAYQYRGLPHLGTAECFALSFSSKKEDAAPIFSGVLQCIQELCLA